MLAIHNSTPTRTENLAPWPYYSEDEIEAAKNTLVTGKVNYWTGQLTKSFENEFARYHNMSYGIALANGTLALELALYGLNIGPGDEVITASKTYIASASCIVQRGAIPVIADVAGLSQNISVRTIEPLITAKTKAVIIVHLGGLPCEMVELVALCKKHNIYLIEDCAQAHGAKYKGKLVGTFGDISAFSFCQDKIISTAGEGGMLLTNNESLYKKMWAFKDHGKSYDLAHQKNSGYEFRWIHESFGSNYRLTEFQSAIGLLQLEKLEGWIVKRRKIAETIINGLQNVPSIIFHTPGPDFYHAYYRLYAFIDSTKFADGWSRTKIIEAINAEGIPCMTGSCSEIYREKAFTESAFRVSAPLPQAEKLSEISIAFLVHPNLDEKYAHDVISAVKKVFQYATELSFEKKKDLNMDPSAIRVLRVVTVPTAFVHIEAQVHFFKGTNFKVDLACSETSDLKSWSQKLATPIIPIHISREISPLNDLKSLCNLTAFLKNKRFDIVHSSTPKAGLLTAIAAFLTKTPIRLHTFTGQRWATLTGLKRYVLKALDRLIIQLNTQCFADSPSQIDFLIAQGVAKKGEVECLGSGSYGGVNMRVFKPGNSNDRNQIETLENLPSVKTRFIYIGRIVADKGLNEALLAFDSLTKKFSEAQFVLVGPSEGERHPLSFAAQEVMKKNKQVFWLGSKTNPQDYLKASDVLVIPSYREGFGTVVIEAAACAIPAIGTRIPGLVDSIIHNDTGILVPAHSVQELQNALEWAIINPEKIKKMGQSALQRCIKEFDSEVISTLTKDQYLYLLNQITIKGHTV